MDVDPAHNPQQGVLVVELRVSDELTTSALPVVKGAVAEILAVRPHVVRLDLSRCPRIDAAGVALLVDLNRHLQRHGGRLTVHEPTPQVRQVLRRAGVDQAFDIVPADAGGEIAIGCAMTPLRPAARSFQNRPNGSSGGTTHSAHPNDLLTQSGPPW